MTTGRSSDGFNEWEQEFAGREAHTGPGESRTGLHNSALVDLEFLLGPWRTKLSHAEFLPEPHQIAIGRADFDVLEEGALIVMRQVIELEGPPVARWVIGRDGSRPDYTVLYSDARDVSRVYQMSFTGDTWRIWRDDPAFSQRFEAHVAENRASMSGSWERRFAGGEWEHDFDVDFERLPAP
ncbi:hypothetical protein SPF06_11800 [Sinomonas sp. JGH33]|uniref:DUF1579 domain-containing protein n=1 Tax=Sinomonas terricola TaxID=3110330 RepID=A0ABU5T8J4_9MICC|nr:hypothetical protein [Sinomonas sp. JGH33]MEA5455406.1 hypothetical protein [Sinomonas sp. JGH33]